MAIGAVGLVGVTGVRSRFVCVAAGVILIVLGLFGALIVLSQGSAVAPFIYTLF